MSLKYHISTLILKEIFIKNDIQQMFTVFTLCKKSTDQHSAKINDKKTVEIAGI